MIFIIGHEYVDCVKEDTFLERLKEDYYGKGVTFLDKCPPQTDPAYWPEGTYLLVKGEVAKPKAKKKVIEWEM